MSYLSLGDNENDDDFSAPMSSMNSNLGSLFGMNAQMDNRAGSNQSLTYTAPKPPRPDKPQKENTEKKSASGGGGIAAAVAITAFKYVNNEYKSQGKLGMALLSNFTEKDYKILMYVSRQQPVTTAKIHSDFQFSVQSNNYASFYDDQRQTWSILFPNSEQLSTFAKQVCLAKFHCQTQAAVVTQELVLGENDSLPLSSGDSVEAKYTGWLVQLENGALGSVFDSNHNNDKTFRFKTGKGKVIKGWEEGMLGMKKGGKRFLVIPPSLAYGSKSVGKRVPPNSTLAFEVDILRMKHQGGESSSVEAAPQVTEQREPSGSFGSSIEAPFAGPHGQEDDNVKGRAASFNEQLSQTIGSADSNKANIVSRMAKVGQPMLPVKPTAPKQEPVVTAPTPVMEPMSEPTRSMSGQADAHSSYSNSPRMQSSPAVQPNVDFQRVAFSPHVMPAVQVPIMQTSIPGNINFQSTGLMGYNSQSIPGGFPQYLNPSGDMLPAILAESQSSNTKLKSLLEKVDDVSDKISKLKPSLGFNDRSNEIMDAAQLSFNIQRIIQENERVKKQILDRDKLVQQQSDKISDLLQQNQKLMEESHEQIAKRNVSFSERFGQTQEKTMQLEQEKLDLTNKLSNATSKICELQLTLANTKERANSLEKIAKVSAGQHENELKIQRLEAEVSSVQSLLESARSENKKMESSFNENSTALLVERRKQEEIKGDYENRIQKLHEEMENLKSELEEKLISVKRSYESSQSDSLHKQQDLEESWKEKCKDAVGKVTKAAETKITEISEERDILGKKLEAFQQRILQMKQILEEKVKRENDLTSEVDKLKGFQQKYDNLRNQAISMKQKYEETIKELQEKSSQLEGSHVDVNAQIKSVMNNVFQGVRSKISAEDGYSGSQILSIILNIIKSTTLNLLESGDGQSNEGDEDEETQDEESSNDDEEEEVREQDDNEQDEKEQPEPSQSPNSENPQMLSTENIPSNSEQNQTKEVVESSENVSSNDVGEEVTASIESQEESSVQKTDDTKSEQDETIDQHIGSGEHQEFSTTKEDEPNEDSDKAKEENIAAEKIPDSPIGDSKPIPPPLFDDDEDDEEDLDWLS